MRLFTVPRGLLGLAAVAFLVSPAPAAGGATPATDDLSAEASYQCQYAGLESEIRTPAGLGLGLPSLGFDLPSLGGSDKVAVKVHVKAPPLVAPGEPVKLTGKATFTFGAAATATNLSTAFTFLSDDFGVNVAVGSSQRLLRISDLKTTRSALGTPVVTTTWTLPEFLVPSSATGDLKLSLPSEEIVTNPVTTKPKAVAFTGSLQSDSLLQPKRAVACALKADQDTALGSVKVAAAALAEPTDAPSVSPAAPPLGGPAVGAPVAAPPLGAAPPGSPAVVTPTVTGPLSAEAIPPPTVPDGLRLPAWALLLIGAFVASGVFLAVSSHRRLRLVAAVAVLIALLVGPTPLNPSPPAEAATSRAQVTLICVYNDTNADKDARARDQPTGLSISLDVPASVRPGEVINLAGTATVQAPEDIRSQAAGLGFNQLDAISDTLSVGVTVGSAKRQVFTADRWQTGKTAFGNPLVVSAPLYFPSFKVPDNASGSIKLDLPRNEVLDRRPPPHSNPRTPPRTALEFVASVSGNGAKATYLVDCWRSDKGTGRIATIPVSKANAPAANPGSGSGQPGARPGTNPAAIPTAGVTPGVTPTGVPTAGSTAVPSGAATAPAVAGGAPLLQGVPAGAKQTSYADEVTVPTWLLVVLGVLAVVGYGYALRNYRKVRAAKTA
ncbi:hypothetical protein ABIE44_000967 [Marmoricola sp. OAE513]|uniref:DUF6801 domain-containing protein n=1 Tax=Marmoricola sp. OAE513 TaxID=2817894 RepID=UPI001AE10C0B